VARSCRAVNSLIDWHPAFGGTVSRGILLTFFSEALGVYRQSHATSLHKGLFISSTSWVLTRPSPSSYQSGASKDLGTVKRAKTHGENSTTYIKRPDHLQSRSTRTASSECQVSSTCIYLHHPETAELHKRGSCCQWVNAITGMNATRTVGIGSQITFTCLGSHIGRTLPNQGTTPSFLVKRPRENIFAQ
jgi:hypothetical protein